MVRRLPNPALALVTGVALGLVAQFLRQGGGPLMVWGAATAPWIIVGYCLAILGARRSRASRTGRAIAIVTMAAYVVAWLVSYHGLFAIRESVGFAAAWREMLPWLVVAGPASLVLGLLAGVAHRGGVLADVALATPIAWSLPEIISGLDGGWLHVAAFAVPLAALTVLPLAAVDRRSVRPLGIALAAAVAGTVVLGSFPLLRSVIHS